MSKSKQAQVQALKRAEIIMKVRCGLITASQGAQELGVSRKTYYQWEQRGLAGLLNNVSEKQPGRPENRTPEDLSLEKELANALRENDLLRQKLKLKDLVSDIKHPSGSDRTEKK
jgi:DNA-binding XRE family transcriptional regulator